MLTGGEVIGKWTAGVRVARQEEEEEEAMPDKVCQTNKEDLLSKAKNNMEKFLNRVEPEEDEGIKEECGKCGGVGVVGYWSGWNEEMGEEIVDMGVCKRCAVGKSGIKYKQ